MELGSGGHSRCQPESLPRSGCGGERGGDVPTDRRDRPEQSSAVSHLPALQRAGTGGGWSPPGALACGRVRTGSYGVEAAWPRFTPHGSGADLHFTFCHTSWRGAYPMRKRFLRYAPARADIYCQLEQQPDGSWQVTYTEPSTHLLGTVETQEEAEALAKRWAC